MNLERLRDPFPAEDIDWRLAQCGESNGKIWAMVLAYIQARAVMDRLDDVCGPENWEVNYQVLSTGIICQLSVLVNGVRIHKQDGAELTEIEAFKGGISGALKRAGACWGIGRYLYNLESGFAEICDKQTEGSKYGKTKEGKVFYWLPPTLPAWALPKKGYQNSEPTGTNVHTSRSLETDGGSNQLSNGNSSINQTRAGSKTSIVRGPVSKLTQHSGGPHGSPVGPTQQELKAEKEPKSRTALITEIMGHASRINCPQQELAEWAQDVFKKPTKEMNVPELTKFCGILEREPSAVGVIK